MRAKAVLAEEQAARVERAAVSAEVREALAAVSVAREAPVEALEAKVVRVGQAVAALVAAGELARQEGPAGDSRGLLSAAQVSSAVVLAKFLTLRNFHR